MDSGNVLTGLADGLTMGGILALVVQWLLTRLTRTLDEQTRLLIEIRDALCIPANDDPMIRELARAMDLMPAEARISPATSTPDPRRDGTGQTPQAEASGLG